MIGSFLEWPNGMVTRTAAAGEKLPLSCRATDLKEQIDPAVRDRCRSVVAYGTAGTVPASRSGTGGPWRASPRRVMESVLAVCCEDDRAALARALLGDGPDGVVSMAQRKFGVYVVRRLLRMSRDSSHRTSGLVAHIGVSVANALRLRVGRCRSSNVGCPLECMLSWLRNARTARAVPELWRGCQVCAGTARTLGDGGRRRCDPISDGRDARIDDPAPCAGGIALVSGVWSHRPRI